MDPPEVIFGKVQHRLPAGACLASGGLLDARGVSDVDVIVIDPARDEKFTIHGYDRVINVKISSDPAALRSVRHRELELRLELEYPAIAARAREAKASGLSTEAAWASVLVLKGCPYEAMLDADAVLETAASA